MVVFRPFTMISRTLSGALILLGLGGDAVLADDWPQFRGPRHDGISLESLSQKNWAEAPPKEIWRAKVGIGFSAVSVAKGKVITSGHIGGDDVVRSFDEQSGKQVWEHRYASDIGAMFYIGGPGSTPTIDIESDTVLVLGKWGELFCLKLTDGSVVWKRHLAKEESLVVPDWGFSGSVLRLENRLILNLGVAGMAIDSRTGKTLWRSDGAESGYSTPVPFREKGKSLVIVSSGEGYSAVDTNTGQQEWSVPWLTRYGVNAADPIIWNDKVFISSGYQKGSGLFELGDGELEMIWKQRKFRAQQNAPVRFGDYLYGFDGDSSSRAMLKCLSLKTGEIVWEDETFGYGALCGADGHLIIISSDGRLGLAEASPSGVAASVTPSVLPADCWTVPVIANGRLYCRNSKGNLVALDLIRTR